MKTSSIEIKVAAGFTAALIMLLIAGGFMYRSISEYSEASRWVAHTNSILRELENMVSDIRLLEDDERGYIITNDVAFLSEEDTIVSRLRKEIRAIDELTIDNPRQQQRNAGLAKLIEDHIDLLNKTVAAYRDEGFDIAREKILNGVSRKGMNAVIAQSTVMENEERTLLTKRTEEAKSSATQTLWIGIFLLVIALTGLATLWRRVVREAQERREAEAVLHESALLQQILDELPVGVIVSNADGVPEQVNPAARQIWVQNGIPGSDQYQSLSGWWPETEKPLSPQDWPLARTLRTGEVIRDEIIDIRCFDGTRKTVNNFSMPIRNGTGLTVSGLSVYIDVTAFKRTERLLRMAARFEETQSKALALFSSSFDRKKILDGLLALLAQKHPVPVLALYGYDEWSGKYSREASLGLAGDAAQQFSIGEGLLGVAAQTRKTMVLDSANLKLLTGIAEFAPAQVLMIPVEYQQRRLAVLVLASTVPLGEDEHLFLERLAVTLGVALDNLRQYSDLKQLAEKLRASSEEIAVKNLQLESGSRMKSEFLANMSHELRTPLNAIIGFSEVMKDGLLGELTAQQKEYVSDIFDSGNHLLSLINDILDLSKVEAGKMTLEIEPVVVSDLIQAGLQVVREKALAHRLHLTAEIAPVLDEIWLDQRKAKQILYNLLSNAVKFTPEGGDIKMTVRRVERSVSKGQPFTRFLEIAVADTGIGISPENQALLFQPFTQIDSQLSRRYSGTGLGLVMVKRLTDLHGGEVIMQSALGKGSTFTVMLPWRTGNEVLSAEQTSHGQGESVGIGVASVPPAPPGVNVTFVKSPVDPHRRLVLVVEDDSKAATLLRLHLERAGFRVIQAATAESALEITARETPDLITLDIHLPGMDGWECLERIRKSERLASIPVVIVSIVADRVRGLAMGANQVLQKPVSHDEFSHALAAVGFGMSPEASRRAVLIIDDDPKSVQIVGTYLDQVGLRVLTAFGGRDGIDCARREFPDLIVLDLMMPEVSGFDVVHELKADAATAMIPIIIITAKQITAEDRAQLGGDVLQVIEKSAFDHDLFISEVNRALNTMVK